MTTKVLNQIHDKKSGFVRKYMEFSVGSEGFLFFLYFELVTMVLKNLPGALGLFLRSVAYRPLFKKTGKNVVLGTNIVLRNPKKIEIHNNSIIDDGCVLDAKGTQCDGIIIGKSAFVSRNVLLGCKNGGIRIGSGSTIGPNTIIHSVDDCNVNIGGDTSIAANCYIIGGPGYLSDRFDIPMIKQGFHQGRGIVIEDDVWLGAGTYVLDGSKIGKGAIIGAMSLVNGNIADYAVAVGIPAVEKKNRKDNKIEKP